VTSAILLYGLSLIFGFTGETNFSRLGPALSALAANGPEGIFALVVALLFVLVGLGFKVAVVPFHFWTPDVYEGSPTPAVAFISTASKAASFGLLVRVFSIVWPAEMIPYWAGLLAAMAAITMVLGNMLALVQKNVKRMLGYSSIAQAGYALIGVVALSDSELGAAAVTFYMAMYVLTNLAAFAVVSAVEHETGSVQIADYAGLSRRSFPLAMVMVVAMLSLGGVPPAAGFFGKFFLFSAAVDSGYTWLAIIGVVNAIIGLFYYLTVIKVIFVGEATGESRYKIRPTLAVVLWVTGIGILLMGTLASPWWKWAVEASQQLAAMLP
jgi:NADH-quinone oxidoreductase subunit N